MNTETTSKEGSLVDRMFRVGAHFGYSKTRRHPSVSDFIFGAKNRTEIFDLEKTSELLADAAAFAEKLGTERKVLLFVGGKNEAKGVVTRAAEEVGMPYVAGRWIGGTLTNFPQIKTRIDRLVELTDEREKGTLAKKYTKRELLMIDREIERLENNFGGLRDVAKVPDALFVVDTKREKIAIDEAVQKGIPVIGLANSDCNLGDVTYPIVGNDASMTSITFFVKEIADAYERGRAQAVPEPKGENGAEVETMAETSAD